MLALFVALGGTGYAAISIPRNSVGTAQLKKNAVNTADIKRNAVTGAKVRADTLRGSDIRESSLSQVPTATLADTAVNATKAANADNATKAATADKATLADTATNLAPVEAWRELGAAGQPAFETGCEQVVAPTGLSPNIAETVAFMKDKQGFVHFKGVFDCAASTNGFLFRLPEGYRPANGKIQVLPASCIAGCVDGGGDDVQTGVIQIFGPGIQTNPVDATGLVVVTGERMTLDGLSFKAGS